MSHHLKINTITSSTVTAMWLLEQKRLVMAKMLLISEK